MTNPTIQRARLLYAIGFLACGCGEGAMSPSTGIRIEAIAAVESGIAHWDPNDDSTLYVHAIGIPDDELGRVVWTQRGLSLADTVAVGPTLALQAGDKGCGYGGVTFVITASSPSRNDSRTISVDMERYLCAGSPWTAP
jgi:hypothetical protein